MSSRAYDSSSGEADWRHLRWREAFPILLISASGIGLLLLATPHGIGVSPDSMQYISAADNLAEGRGLRAHWWEPGAQPLTHFPPGFPVALAALSRLGMTALQASRLLNVVALVVTMLFTFGLARKATGSTISGLFAATVLVLARDVLEAHSMVWSEPLFLALVLATIYFTVVVIETNNRIALLWAALLAALASLTRYAAPPLIVACAIALLLLGAGSWRQHLARTVTFGVIAVLPLAALLAFNAAQGGPATNRELAFHPPGLAELDMAVRTAFYWVVPVTIPDILKLLLFGPIVIAALAWFAIRARSRSGPRAVSSTRVVLALFGVCYAAFMMGILTLVDAQSTPGPRLLLPLVPVLTILAVAQLSQSLKVPRERRSAQAVAVTLGLGVLLATASWVHWARQHGLGYNSPAWQRSPLIAQLRGYDPETLIYTNKPAAVLFHTGREVLGIPRMANPNSRKPDVTFADRMGEVCRTAGSRTVIYAHFVQEHEWFLPSLADVRARWRSNPRFVGADGVLDVVPPTCGTAPVARSSGVDP